MCYTRAAINPFDPASIEIGGFIRMRGRVDRNPTTITLRPQKPAVIGYIHRPVRSDRSTVWATPHKGEGTGLFIPRDDGDSARANLDDEHRAIRESYRSLWKRQTSGQFSNRIRSNGSHRDDHSLQWLSGSVTNSIFTAPPQVLQCRHQCYHVDPERDFEEGTAWRQLPVPTT